MPKKWKKFNGMASTPSYNKQQKNFWRPPTLNVENSTEKKVSKEKSNKEPEQLELKL